MTPDTQMTLALLQELMMTLRANDVDGYKSWLALGIDELGRDVAGEVESEEMIQVVFFEGGARDPRVNTMFQVSNVDDGGIHWVNGDEVTQILTSSSD